MNLKIQKKKILKQGYYFEISVNINYYISSLRSIAYSTLYALRSTNTEEFQKKKPTSYFNTVGGVSQNNGKFDQVCGKN